MIIFTFGCLFKKITYTAKGRMGKKLFLLIVFGFFGWSFSFFFSVLVLILGLFNFFWWGDPKIPKIPTKKSKNSKSMYRSAMAS